MIAIGLAVMTLPPVPERQKAMKPQLQILAIQATAIYYKRTTKPVRTKMILGLQNRFLGSPFKQPLLTLVATLPLAALATGPLPLWRRIKPWPTIKLPLTLMIITCRWRKRMSLDLHWSLT